METNKNTTSDQTAVLRMHQEKNHKTIEEKAIESRIDLTVEYTPPLACMEVNIEGKLFPMLGLGDYSLITGQAKSGKTFWVTSILAAALNNKTAVHNLIAQLPESQQTCLFFDTEQSASDVQKAARRVLKMADLSKADHFITHSLRKYNASERMKIIEHIIDNTPNIGLVVIDGVRDLIDDINSVDDAKILTQYLLRLTEKRNIHIICVIHQNKHDENARGHVGAELLNKSQIEITIKKVTKGDRSSFIVENKRSRDIGFTSFAFQRIDEELYLVEGSSFFQTLSAPKRFAIADYSEDQHREVLELAFNGRIALKYNELKISLTDTFAKQGIILTQIMSRMLLKYYPENNFLKRSGKIGTKNSTYTLVTTT